MVWPTLRFRTAKEGKRTGVSDLTSFSAKISSNVFFWNNWRKNIKTAFSKPSSPGKLLLTVNNIGFFQCIKCN